MNLFTNLAKAAVGVVIGAPVALVADILTLPASASDERSGPFQRTGNVFDNVRNCFNEAVKPQKD